MPYFANGNVLLIGNHVSFVVTDKTSKRPLIDVTPVAADSKPGHVGRCVGSGMLIFYIFNRDRERERRLEYGVTVYFYRASIIQRYSSVKPSERWHPR